MRVWVTRAQPGADATAARLTALGHAPLVAPLLRMEAMPGAALPLEGLGALVFTSANAVRTFSERQDSGRDLRAYVVGAATAQAARDAGFGEVRSADGDVAALIRAIAAEPPAGPVLHPCAETAAGDLAAGLRARGIGARVAPIYRTVADAALPDAATEALSNDQLDAVLLHSPRAAEALASMAGDRLARVAAFGLSQACLAPLATVTLAGRQTASRPEEETLLSLLA